MITAERSDHKMTRHVTFFKKISSFIPTTSKEKEDDEDEDNDTPTPIIQPPRQVQQPPQQPPVPAQQPQPQRYNMRSNRRPPKRFGFDE